jgi:hypothetical protein
MAQLPYIWYDPDMRTTVDIPDSLYRRLKSQAALQGCSVKTLILHGVEAELNGGALRKTIQRVRLPLVPSKRPGTLKLSNRTVNEIILP